MIQRFLSFLEEVSEKIREEIDKNSRFLILSANNADGLSSSILLMSFFYKNDIEAHFRFVDVIDENFFDLLFGDKEKSYDLDVFIFLDFGSRIFGKIFDNLKNSNKKVFIIDHHDFASRIPKVENFYQINPNIFGIDGRKEVSSSCITYYLLKYLGYLFKDENIFGLVGAISEKQDIKELSGLNRELLNENSLIEVRKGLKIIGIKGKPLYKAISSSFNIYIPFITGSDEKSLEFLKEIFPDKKIDKIKYIDLNPDEEKKLINEIIKRRVLNNILLNEDIIGEIYLLKEEKDIGDLFDLSFLFISCISTMNHDQIIKYFFDRKNYNSLREVETIFRSKISKNIVEILKKEKNIEDFGNIISIEIKKDESTVLSPYLSEILSFNNLLDKKVYIVYEDANEYYRVCISKPKKTEDIINIIKGLSDKFKIYYGTENPNTFYIKKTEFKDFKTKIIDLISKFS